MRAADALNAILMRIDRLSAELVADDSLLTFEMLLKSAPSGQIEINMNTTGKLVSYIKSAARSLKTPQDSNKILHDFPLYVYEDVNTLIVDILGETRKTDTELCTIQSIILFNIAKIKEYSKNRNRVDPYASYLWLYRVRFLTNGDCKKAASKIDNFIRTNRVTVDTLNELVSEIESFQYLEEILRIAKSNMYIPSIITQYEDKGRRRPLDELTDTWLGNSAQIVCIESSKPSETLEIVWSIFRYMLTYGITVKTETEERVMRYGPGGDGDFFPTGKYKYGTPYHVYETDKYVREIRSGIQAMNE